MINLSSLNYTQGFPIYGDFTGGWLGQAVTNIGDINADGIDDIAVGAVQSSFSGRSNAGATYVIYGRKTGYHQPIDLRYLNNTDGFVILGGSLIFSVAKEIGCDISISSMLSQLTPRRNDEKTGNFS